jgi:hypothetical protein
MAKDCYREPCMSDDSNIIEFDIKTSNRKLGVKNQLSKEYGCKHIKLLADVDNKVLECEQCGFIYTPWEYVMKLAKSEDRVFTHLHRASQEKNRLQAEVEDLKRQVKNVKAQLRRAKSAL